MPRGTASDARAPRHRDVYWQVGGRFLPARAAVPRHADAVVLGAGLTGLSAARAMAVAGLRVVVMESGRIGDGASGRNGGQVLTGLNPSYRWLVETLGRDAARALWAEGHRAVADVEAVINAAPDGERPEWHRGGHLALALTSARWRRLAADAEALAADGFEIQVQDARDTARRIGWESYAGSLYDPGSATVNPYHLATALARSAERAGAVIVEEATGQVAGRSGSFAVTGPFGTIRAEQVLAAGNYRLPAVVPQLVGRILPVQGSMLATDVLPDAVRAALLPGRPAAFEESWRVAHFQITHDGRLVFGGRIPDGTAPGHEAEGLTALLREAVPPAQHVRVAYFWRGPLAITAHGLPALGRSARGIHWVGGYSGHGVALAVRLGAQMGQWIACGSLPSWPQHLPQLSLPLWAIERWRPTRQPPHVYRRSRPVRIQPLG
jgi:gamma-glutamylputrescine oxidase